MMASDREEDWVEFLAAEQDSLPRRRVSWSLLLLIFSYCGWVFWGAMSPVSSGQDETSVVAPFVRRYLALTSGCQHRFYRQGETWFVASNRISALQNQPEDADTRFVLAGSDHRLSIHRYSTKKMPEHFTPGDLASGDRIDFQFLTTTGQASLGDNKVSLVFREGDHPVYGTSIDLRGAVLAFAFNEEQRQARVTSEGCEHLPLSVFGKRTSAWVPVVWQYGELKAREVAVIDLRQCRDGKVTIRPPWTFWLQVALQKVLFFLKDPWTGYAFYLFLFGVLLAKSQLRRSPFSPRSFSALVMTVQFGALAGWTVLTWPASPKSPKEVAGPTRLGGVVQAFLAQTRGCTYTYLQKNNYPRRFWLVYSSRRRGVEPIVALVGHDHTLSIVELKGQAPSLADCANIESKGHLRMKRDFHNFWITDRSNDLHGWAEERTFCFGAGSCLEISNGEESVRIENQDTLASENAVSQSPTELESGLPVSRLQLWLKLVLESVLSLLALSYLCRNSSGSRQVFTAVAFEAKGISRR